MSVSSDSGALAPLSANEVARRRAAYAEALQALAGAEAREARRRELRLTPGEARQIEDELQRDQVARDLAALRERVEQLRAPAPQAPPTGRIDALAAELRRLAEAVAPLTALAARVDRLEAADKARAARVEQALGELGAVRRSVDELRARLDAPPPQPARPAPAPDLREPLQALQRQVEQLAGAVTELRNMPNPASRQGPGAGKNKDDRYL
jgi:DNA repair exonuclease SbcCD ATPase subunit